MRSMTDEQLMHLYQGGDEDAFRELYGRYHHQLEAFVVNTLNALCPAFLSDVADILQTIFTWVHSYRGQFIAGTMVKPWLYSTANRLTRNHIEFETRKRRDFRRSAALEPDTAEGDVSQREAEARQQDHEMVQRCMSVLSPTQQEVIRLIYFEGYTAQEVADKLGVPKTTVDWRRRESLARMRDSP
jgi:RNA polymerase sigma-70 factor, ECF subfamily